MGGTHSMVVGRAREGSIGTAAVKLWEDRCPCPRVCEGLASHRYR